MAVKFRLVIKNGDSQYTFNDGKSDWKTVDYVDEFDSFGDALAEFLSWTDNGKGEDKVSLVFIPEKPKKSKDK